jgi:predicted Zn-dependent protease
MPRPRNVQAYRRVEVARGDAMRTLWPVVFLVSVAAPAQQHQPGAGVNFYSKTEEIAAGQEMARQFRADTTPLANAAVSEYVDRVGAALAAQLPGGWTYRFDIVQENGDGPTLEPVAFPGGRIFVSAELIAAARNEANSLPC